MDFAQCGFPQIDFLLLPPYRAQYKERDIRVQTRLLRIDYSPLNPSPGRIPASASRPTGLSQPMYRGSDFCWKVYPRRIALFPRGPTTMARNVSSTHCSPIGILCYSRRHTRQFNHAPETSPAWLFQTNAPCVVRAGDPSQGHLLRPARVTPGQSRPSSNFPGFPHL